jgi:hypothetical protein
MAGITSTCITKATKNQSEFSPFSSASPKTPAKNYKMASNFELSDEQPPEANRLKRPFKPSGTFMKWLLHETRISNGARHD